MASPQHAAWMRAGSSFRLARPLAKLRDRLRGYGYTVYDIGNQQHLDHQPPEDHTPFSATGWPVKTPNGVGTAIDIMPPAAGSGLPTLAELGMQILADRMHGDAEADWLKYMNWEPGDGGCYQESFKPGHVRVRSTDRGHIHLSQRSDMVDSTLADSYDPVARIRGGGGMSDVASTAIERWSQGFPTMPDGQPLAPVVWRQRDEAWQKKIEAAIAEIKAQQSAASGVIQGVTLDQLRQALVEILGRTGLNPHG